MRPTFRMPVAFCVLAFSLAIGPARGEVTGTQPEISCAPNFAPMARLELLFGMSRRDAEPISDREWQDFVDEEVTPRFPDRLTIVEAYGQWRNRAGAIIKENSRVLMIWYELKPDSEARIDSIRDAYKSRFKQES
jgi:Protein of unknown function (DUF3574)